MTQPSPATIMTERQYEQLASLFMKTHEQTRDDARLDRAASAIDRCDGSTPEATRLWIRALDGWAEEDVADTFMLSLAKTTTTGDLLEEIRRWTLGTTAVATKWMELRPLVLEHFLSACELVKLQAKLETLRRILDVSYQCRFDPRRSVPPPLVDSYQQF